MTLESILIACGIGIIAGALASFVMKGRGSGILRDLVIGLVGGFIGHWLIPKMGIELPAGYAGHIIASFAGAVVLLLVIRLVV